MTFFLITHCFNHLYSCDIYKVLIVYVIVIISLHMTIGCFSSICLNEIKDSKAQMMLRYLANHSILCKTWTKISRIWTLCQLHIIMRVLVNFRINWIPFHNYKICTKFSTFRSWSRCTHVLQIKDWIYKIMSLLSLNYLDKLRL